MILEKVLRELYASEINCGVQSFLDGGWSAWLGLNYADAVASEMNLDFHEVANWLHEHAVINYPNSEYAKKHG